MATSKKANPDCVSTASILREINKAMAEVRLRLKGASPMKQKDLNVKLERLEDCKKLLDIWHC
jgi:hypothetical protein